MSGKTVSKILIPANHQITSLLALLMKAAIPGNDISDYSYAIIAYLGYLALSLADLDLR
jgi:hypothetical protein